MTNNSTEYTSKVSGLTLKGYAIRPVVDEELLAELIRTIPDNLPRPQFTTMETEPPAAGMSEVATVIELINNSRELILAGIVIWQSQAAKHKWKGLRHFLSNARKSKISDRVYIPLCIAVGNFRGHGCVRFYFHGRPDPETLDYQWKKMRELISSLPDEAFERSPGPQEYGFFWHYDLGEWKGQLFDPDSMAEAPSESWIPRNIFEAD